MIWLLSIDCKIGVACEVAACYWHLVFSASQFSLELGPGWAGLGLVGWVELVLPGGDVG